MLKSLLVLAPQEAVKVVSLPPRDPFDWITWTANLLLVAVGIGGIIVACLTLRKIERQTKAGENAAQAAFLSAQAVVNSERAWLDIECTHVCLEKSPTLYRILVNNHGKSPAFVTKLVVGRAYWADKIDDIPEGFVGHVAPETMCFNNVVPASREPITIMTLDVAKYPSGDDGRKVTFHQQITYNDIFGQEHRTESVFLASSSGFLQHLPPYTHYITTKQHRKSS